jgi:hypothetical protein
MTSKRETAETRASQRTQADARAARRTQQVRERRNVRAQQYHRNKRELMIWKIVGAVGAAALLLLIGYGIYQWGQDRELNRQPEGVRTFQYVGAQHRDGPIDYSAEPEYQGEVPPAGGVHNNSQQQCGYYDKPVPWSLAVHTLEHGAIWITYRPDLPADQIEKLREMASEREMLVSPEPNLPAPIVATAWNHQITVDSADSEQLKRFIRFYKDNPEVAPEAAAGCETGSTETMQ